MLDILAGNKSTARDIALLNAGAAIYVAGITKNILEGVELAKDAVDSGNAHQKLEALVNNSHE